jgi:hypothetical protein
MVKTKHLLDTSLLPFENNIPFIWMRLISKINAFLLQSGREVPHRSLLSITKKSSAPEVVIIGWLPPVAIIPLPSLPMGSFIINIISNIYMDQISISR